MNQESFMSGHHASSRTIGIFARFTLCLVAPLALAGCSSRKGEMLIVRFRKMLVSGLL